LTDQGVDSRKILNRQNAKMWVKIGSCCDLLLTWEWTLEVHLQSGVSYSADRRSPSPKSPATQSQFEFRS